MTQTDGTTLRHRRATGTPATEPGSHLALALAIVTGLLCASPLALAAQYELLPAGGFPVAIEKDGRPQTLAGLGGLNHPQFYSVDVDGDGLLDYYAFDRAGDVHVAFGPADASRPGALVDKTYAVRDWPAVENFVIPRDFDGDGVPDLFASSSGEEFGQQGLLVYRGRREADGTLGFERLDFGGDFGPVLPYRVPDRRDQFVYVAQTDIPAVEDVDDDGDLDVLAFDPSGSFVYFYRNDAAPAGGGGGTARARLDFELASRCYGGVAEDVFTSELRLADGPGECAPPQARAKDRTERGGLHPGSTLTVYDLDGDGDRDALVGDVQTSVLTALYNEPAGQLAYYGRLVPLWPDGPEEAPVDLDFFPVAFPVAAPGADVGAGPTDFLVTSNQSRGGQDFAGAWYYARDSATGRLDLVTRSFATELAFDHGTGAHPASGQLDGRGAPELIVGNEGTYTPGAVGDLRAGLRYYACPTDDACVEERPAWLARINAALQGRPAIPNTGFDPVLHDMDADGDLDLLVGYSEEGIAYARNVTPAGGAVDFELVSERWLAVENAVNASPAVADVDGDGLPDLLVGQQNGRLSLFLNVGTAAAPRFSPTPTEADYAGIDVRLPGFARADSRPAFVRTGGGELALYIGTAQGRLLIYDRLPMGSGGFARPADTIVATIGEQLDPSAGFDVDRGQPIVLVGTQRGGVVPFRFADSVPVTAPRSAAELAVVPNPTTGAFRVEGVPPGTPLTIFDAVGRRLAGDHVTGTAALGAVLPKGVYFVRVGSDGGSGFPTLRVVKQ